MSVIHWLEQLDSKKRRRWESTDDKGTMLDLVVYEVNGPNGVHVGRDFIPASYRYEVSGYVSGANRVRVSFNGVMPSSTEAMEVGARLWRLLHLQEQVTKAVRSAVSQ